VAPGGRGERKGLEGISAPLPEGGNANSTQRKKESPLFLPPKGKRRSFCITGAAFYLRRKKKKRNVFQPHERGGTSSLEENTICISRRA